jgi:hypothetical protein
VMESAMRGRPFVTQVLDVEERTEELMRRCCDANFPTQAGCAHRAAQTFISMSIRPR